MRMLGFQGPAQPSPELGDVLNVGYRYLEVRCLGCDTHQTVALDVVRRRRTPIHELERYMRCKDCSRLQGRPYKRSHLIALRPTKISAMNPPSHGGRANSDQHLPHEPSCVPEKLILTLVAVWRAEDPLMAVADTRIVRAPGNVLTEHGPKLLPITVVCKQPGPSGLFDGEVRSSRDRVCLQWVHPQRAGGARPIKHPAVEARWCSKCSAANAKRNRVLCCRGIR